MKLIKCENCGLQIPQKAMMCIYCKHVDKWKIPIYLNLLIVLRAYTIWVWIIGIIATVISLVNGLPHEAAFTVAVLIGLTIVRRITAPILENGFQAKLARQYQDFEPVEADMEGLREFRQRMGIR